MSSPNSKQAPNPLVVNLTDAEWKAKLTPEEYRVLREKGTDEPYKGKYNEHKETGTYNCAGCGQALYESSSKFDSHCGWPAFSSSIDIAVRRQKDKDGRREEILCANCDGHLGHVFTREGIRDAHGNVVQERHCVNSVSLKFAKKTN